ncbi:Phosphatidate cytidylyltransferase [Macleaya cordata]|uniref:Phosphatidate cytidylyltransferase n=1 Tax=Macleaya cordata TaxID=56857 RepID=A0A200PX22_MACCD|nr:Phosphatidate cytidylyltransferase [Macleaya cordata]
MAMAMVMADVAYVSARSTLLVKKKKKNRKISVFNFRHIIGLIIPNLRIHSKTPYAIPPGRVVFGNNFGLRAGGSRFNFLTTSVKASMFPQNPMLNDICAAAIAGAVALSLLQFWGEIAKRRILKDQKLIRKIVHINIGLVFMLLWPLFSYECQAAVLAALVPGVNIIRMLVLGLGILKDEAMVKSMSRSGDYRELLKGPLYYASTITLASVVYWRTSPIAIAAICNLCAGDGVADIVGRRFGSKKLPHNRNKSYAGSIAMAAAGFLASVGYMHYFSQFGFIEESPGLVLGFLIVSLVAALVESLPISTELDDNLTVPLTSILVGSLVF